MQKRLYSANDDDDISVPDHFERQLVNIMAYPHIDVFGGQIIEFGMELPPAAVSVPLNHKEIKRMIGLRNMINHVTVCVCRWLSQPLVIMIQIVTALRTMNCGTVCWPKATCFVICPIPWS